MLVGMGVGLGHKGCIAGCKFVGLCHCFIPSVQLRGSEYHIGWFPTEAATPSDCRAVLV